MRLASCLTSCVLVVASFVGCGSSSSGDGAAPPSGSGGSGGATGGAGGDAGGTGGSAGEGVGGTAQGGGGGAPSISGSLDLAPRVIDASAKPRSGIPVRVENAAGGFLETTTGSDGVAHLMVDPAGGPYDVTIANAGEHAVSILGVSAKVGDVFLYPPSVPTATVSGKIVGAKSASDIVSVSSNLFTTGVVPMAGLSTYTATYANEGSALRAAALDIDPTGKLLAGIVTPPVETGGDATLDIDFTTAGASSMNLSFTVTLPTSGVVTAAQLDTIMDTFGAGLVSANVAVVQLDTSYRAQTVGIASATKPDASGASAIVVQGFGGQLFPSTTLIDYFQQTTDTPSVHVVVTPQPLGDVTVPPINSLQASGSGGTITFGGDAPGYDAIGFEIWGGTPGNPGGTLVWIGAGATGGQVSTRAVPTLPAGLHLSDLGGPYDAYIPWARAMKLGKKPNFGAFVQRVGPATIDVRVPGPQLTGS